MSTLANEETGEAVNRAPSKRTRIMRGIVTPTLGLLAVACIVFGVLNATVWKPSGGVEASASVESPYLVTDPGVLQLVDDQVTVTARLASGRASGVRLCMAMGSAQDAVGWMAGQRYERVRGLDGWTKLDTASERAPGRQAKTADQVDFEHSDMWRQVKCGAGSVTMAAEPQEGQVAIISVEKASGDMHGSKAAARKGAAKPKIDMTMRWEHRKVSNYSLPLYIAGGLLAVLAVLSATVFAMEPVRRRKAGGGDGRERPEVTVAEAFGGVLAPVFSMFRRSKSGKRHSRPAGEGPDGTEGRPKVVDVSAKNMVADQQAAGDEATGTDAAEPPVLNIPSDRGQADSRDHEGGADRQDTGEDMQDYLARLADEVAVPEGPGTPEASHASPDDREEEVPDATGQAGGAEDASADLDDSTVGAFPSADDGNPMRDGMHDSTVGAFPAIGDDAGSDGGLDDSTDSGEGDGISDETTEVFEPEGRTRARGLKAGDRRSDGKAKGGRGKGGDR
ncbi:ICP22 family protein [Bifidobacterium xylocopae]|uniref:GTPase n=1 Tax=Bifidobacterium xylocopae TaxID=2493119 RepID=A0A366KDX5_9BIFI|nr:hypothetical protein [Bifidobacterium xylocopae]RBP98871.1 hypothetical protein CRD59_06740 [Bifidobacterium xylocopae]